MPAADFLGLNRNLVLLLGALVALGVGDEMSSRFLPKYLDTLGAGVLIIAIYDGLRTLLGAVSSYPAGVLADRWGERRALLSFSVVTVAGYAVALAAPHWGALLAGMMLFLSWSNFSLPAMLSMVGATLPASKFAMGIGVQSLIRRIPMILGPLAGGLLLDRYGVVSGVRLGFAGSIGLGLGAILLQRGLRGLGGRNRAAPAGFRATVQAFDPRLRQLLWSDILIRFCERLPHAWVVIYAIDHVGVSATQVGILTAIEMLVAMACYVPVAHLADRYGKEPFVIATFIFFTLFPVSMLWADSFLLLALAFAIRGLKEFGEPARKALIVGYAPPESRAQTVGAYYLIRDTVVTVGSFLGAALWRLGPAANFQGAALLGAAGCLLYSRAALRPSFSRP